MEKDYVSIFSKKEDKKMPATCIYVDGNVITIYGMEVEEVARMALADAGDWFDNIRKMGVIPPFSASSVQNDA